MSQSSSVKFDAESLVIRDPELIAKYLQSYSKFYIPPNEEDTFDPINMVNETYVKSRQAIGTHHPIDVAICESDPHKYDFKSEFKIHLRIMDGRHRWKQSIKVGQEWVVKFYVVSDYNQFMLLRGHFDSKKDTNPMERIKFFGDLCKYYEEVLKFPKPRVCAEICKDYSPAPFHEATIRRYIPIEYKDMQKIAARMESIETQKVDTIKEIQEKRPEALRNDFARFRHQISSLYKENEYLRAKIGTYYYEGVRFIIETKNKSENSWNFTTVVSTEKEATDFMKNSDFGARVVKIEEERKIVESNEKNRIVKSTMKYKVIKVNNQKASNNKKIITITKNMLSQNDNEINCEKCKKDLLLNQQVYSKGKNTRTKKGRYYCIPCAKKLKMI